MVYLGCDLCLRHNESLVKITELKFVIGAYTCIMGFQRVEKSSTYGMLKV